MAAAKDKSALKQVFAGLNDIYLYKKTLTLDSTLDLSTPDFDLPVTVDSFSFSQATPTINGTKVHGLNANWCATSEAGEISISMTVPSVSSHLNSYFLGADGTSISLAANKFVDAKTAFTGSAYELKDHKIVCSFAIVDEAGENMVVISGIALYATPNFENASTTPFSWTLTGTIEASDSSSKNIAFFKKNTTV